MLGLNECIYFTFFFTLDLKLFSPTEIIINCMAHRDGIPHIHSTRCHVFSLVELSAHLFISWHYMGMKPYLGKEVRKTIFGNDRHGIFVKMFISICHYSNCYGCLPFTKFEFGWFICYFRRLNQGRGERITMKCSFKLSTKLRWNDCHSNLFWPNYEDCKLFPVPLAAHQLTLTTTRHTKLERQRECAAKSIFSIPELFSA